MPSIVAAVCFEKGHVNQPVVNYIRTRASMRNIAITLTSALLTGCCGGLCSRLDVAAYNYKGDDDPAAIYVSEPQVFERAALINDRRRELAFLVTKLNKSEQETFEPTIVRNLKVVREVGAALSIAADPAAGLRLDNALDKEKKVAELEQLTLDAQIALAKQRLAEAEGGTLGSDTPAPTITVNQPDTDISALQESVTKLTNDLAAANEAIEGLKADITSGSDISPKPRKSEVSSTPLEAFRDLEAYRSELRQAISAIRLDDSHDADGNTLYRLQFHVTVLPGAGHGRWAMVHLGLKKPGILRKEQARLYVDWLHYVNRQINTFNHCPNQDAKRTSIEQAARLVALGSTPAYELVTVEPDGQRRCTKDPINAVFAVPSNVAQDTQDFINSCKTACPTAGPELAFFGATLQQVTSKWGGYRNAFLRQLDTMSRHIGTGQPRQKISAPQVFVDFVTNSGEERMSAYSVLPTQRTQIVSTTTNVSNAVNLALSLNKALNPAGISGAFGGNFDQSVMARIDALERIPRVVSFASGTTKTDSTANHANAANTDEPTASFGWLFGPKATLHRSGKALTFTHRPEPHRVLADISIPAWWPAIEFEVRTCWVGKSWSAGNFASCTPDAPITKRLPSADSDYAALASALVEELLFDDPEPTGASMMVYPEQVASCAGATEFTIIGDDLWRDPEVFALGKRATDVRVLPGMSGITATFDIAGFHKEGRITSGQAEFDIDVFTRRTRDYASVRIAPGRGAGPCSGSTPNATTLTLALPRIVAGNPIAIDLTGSLPSTFESAAIGLRPTGNPKQYARVSAAGNTLRVTPTGAQQIAKYATPSAVAGDGSEVEAKLYMVGAAGQEERAYPVAGRAVFYHAEPVVRVQNVGATSSATRVVRVALQFPKAVAKGFPGADPNTTIYSGELRLPDESAIPVTTKRVAGRWPVRDGTGKGQYLLDVSPRGPAAVERFKGLPAGTALRLMLAAVGGPAEFPAISELAITK